MLSRFTGLRAVVRLFSGSARYSTEAQTASKKFLSPDQYVAKQAEKTVQNEEFLDSLLAADFEYKPLIINSNAPKNKKQEPIPLNVELLQYKPLRLPQTHGHKVAELSFKGYDSDDLLRASDFAARAAFYLGIPCSKIEVLKPEKRLYTVIRSPFAQAKSKENWWRVTHRQELVAYDANPEVIDLWISYINKNAIEGVKYEAQIHTQELTTFDKELSELTAEDIKLPEAYTHASADPVSSRVQELLKSDEFKKALEEK